MRNLRIFIILMLMTASFGARAGETGLKSDCVPSVIAVSEQSTTSKISAKVEQEIFKPDITIKGIKLAESHSLEGPMKKEELDSNLEWLLIMTGNTLSYKVSAKALDTKGEFYLAQPLGDGTSLEYTYSADKRLGNLKYNLTSIYLIRKSGQRLNLNSSPLIDEGTSLSQNLQVWTVKEKETQSDPIALETKNIDASINNQLRENYDQDADSNIKLISEGFSDPENAQKFRSALSDIDTVSVPTAISGPLLERYIMWLTRLGKLKAELLGTAKKSSLGYLHFRYRVSDLLELLVSGGRSFLSRVLIYSALAVAAGSGFHSQIAHHFPVLGVLEQSYKNTNEAQFGPVLAQYSAQESGLGGHISMFVLPSGGQNLMIEYFEKSELMLVTPLNGKSQSFSIVKKKDNSAQFATYLKLIGSGTK